MQNANANAQEKKRKKSKKKKKKNIGCIGTIKRMDSGTLAPSVTTDVHVRRTRSHQRPIIIVILILLEKVAQIGATLANCSVIPFVR